MVKIRNRGRGPSKQELLDTLVSELADHPPGLSFTFESIYCLKLLVEGRLQDTTYMAKLTLHFRKACEILDHYGYSLDFKVMKGKKEEVRISRWSGKRIKVSVSEAYDAVNTDSRARLLRDIFKTHFEAAIAVTSIEVFFDPRGVLKKGYNDQFAVEVNVMKDLDEMFLKFKTSLAEMTLAMSYAQEWTDPTQPSETQRKSVLESVDIHSDPDLWVWQSNQWQRVFERIYSKITETEAIMDFEEQPGRFQGDEIDPARLERGDLFREAALWLRWCKRLVEYSDYEEMMDLWNSKPLANYPRICELEFYHLGNMETDDLRKVLDVLRRIAQQPQKLTEKGTGTYPIDLSLLQYIYEYLYTYMPGDFTEKIGSFREAMKARDYSMSYKLIEQTGHLAQGQGGPIKQVKLPSKWGATGSIKWGYRNWYGSMGYVIANIAEGILHEELELYLLNQGLTELSKEGDVRHPEGEKSGGRTVAHFITQAYIMHLAHAGFFDYMMKGLLPGPEVYAKMENVDLKTIFEQFLTKHWYTPIVSGETKDPEYDMRQYILKWGGYLHDELGWGPTEEMQNIEQWYPFFVSRKQEKIPRYSEMKKR
ncbi:hypothetical protein JXM67_15075 [candidate division WOR-3 bacterium]|nr:hypothetical protein [candidate division WOR-3 bacterium]